RHLRARPAAGWRVGAGPARALRAPRRYRGAGVTREPGLVGAARLRAAHLCPAGRAPGLRAGGLLRPAAAASPAGRPPGGPRSLDFVFDIRAMRQALETRGGRKAGLRPLYESLFPSSPDVARDPKGCAAGAPNVPDRGEVPEGGACPPLH